MGWTAPATYSVSQIMLAADMNLIRDNLNYLKGNAGAIAISDRVGITVAPNNVSGDLSLDSGYGAVGDYHQINWQGHSAIRGIATAGGQMGLDFILQNGASATVNTGVNVMRMRGDGSVGIGTTAPNGRLHGYDTIAGFMHWKYDGVDGTARTVIADGTGDVLYRLMAMFVTRADNGATAAGSFASAVLVPGGGDAVIDTQGADTLALRVNANGSVDIRRNAGATRTWKVSLWCLWL